VDTAKMPKKIQVELRGELAWFDCQRMITSG